MSRAEIPTADVARVTVVQSAGCHFCADAQAALADLATRYPLQVQTVDIQSPLGLRLVQEHRAPMNPLVLLDGEYFSSGRLPRRKLAARLGKRFAGAAASTAV